jgi:DNA-binding ferritin-like protein (Dps family)
MRNFVTKLIGDRTEWKRMEARGHALPRDYRREAGAGGHR